jgi:hypothetical protein
VSRSGRGNRLTLALVSSKETPADESASQRQECFVDVSPLLVADSQAAKLIEPSECSFYHPTPSTQSTTVFSVSLGEPRPDPANS